MDRVTGVSKEDWVKNIKRSPELPDIPQLDGLNPANSYATDAYRTQATAMESSGTPPQSIFEGIQTVADLARVRSKFNPLDPEGTGNKAHFLKFSQRIANAPFLALITGDTITVQTSSHNSNELVDSFVKGFTGIGEKDKDQIIGAVTDLANAALSYSDRIEKYSNFAQNILDVDGDGNVLFHLYSSQFQIEASERKGSITFNTQYNVVRGVYQLSVAKWEEIKDLFAFKTKVSTQEWLSNFKTPCKPGATAKTPCLTNKK